MIVYGKTDQETIELTAKSFGIPLVEAEFILAIARGEVSGQFAIPEKKAAVRKKRVVLAPATRKTLERLKEALHKGKTKGARGVGKFSGFQGSKNLKRMRGETAVKLAKKAIKPEVV
jgi:hypothetical protein